MLLLLWCCLKYNIQLSKFVLDGNNILISSDRVWYYDSVTGLGTTTALIGAETSPCWKGEGWYRYGNL